MSKNTDELNANSKEDKKNKENLVEKGKKVAKKSKENKEKKQLENKSIQNRVIENIKSFITKIIEMQEKVKKDEVEEKELAEKEKLESLREDTNISHTASPYLLEYYDLPFRYNETVVKILAQTPKRLFVYWDVSDRDKQTYLNAFGESFFYDTYPVLLVHNESKNETVEIAINDFANSWYLDIPNPRDKYTIQLGRKFKNHVRPTINSETEENNLPLNNDYLFIAMSNQLEVPNDHILFEEFKPYVKYRNVKTNQENVKDVTNSIYTNELKKLYQELYHEEISIAEGKYDMLNPSSMGTSSSIAK